ncbi:MAG: FliA/WhiG family RNA polymerase sigma factor [SAR324 cluster bacterium]|nr:FliA/WhiG family RNA polymerase sigma factor [SAR324 cluster bacterium]MCZ6644851.1 FliA/WhiG family RNA polymerase sigma factor [SAR324 cluster bacterium]
MQWNAVSGKLEQCMNNPYAQYAYQGKSREEMVLEYAPLVKQIANRLAARLPDNLDRQDLIQAGMIGLLDAIEKYDPQKETRFRTYAEFRVRGAMLDDLRASDWIPRSVRENADRVGRAIRSLQSELGRQPEEAEIADSLKISLAEYHTLLLKAKAVPLLSLENLGSFEGDEQHGSIFDLLEDPDCTDPLDTLALQHLQERLSDAIRELPEKEQLLLTMYYDEELNLKEIGAVMGVTESRASQIRTQSIMRLRNALKSTAPTDLIDRMLDRRAT